jgi:V8-like Glu-specific endopeptidase
MSNHPHKGIGFVQMEFKGEKASGTGLLISPNLVLTCGHNIFSNKIEKGNQYATKIHFYPGHRGELGKGYEMESYYLPKEFP